MNMGIKYNYNPFTEKLDTVADFNTTSVDELSDVDTTTITPTQNKVLKWNGTNWIPGFPGSPTEFTFSVASFDDNETATQLIGSGVWRALNTIHFTQTYNNGPPSSGCIVLTSDGGVTWNSNLTLVSPFTTGSSAEATNYTNAKDKSITFTLNANVSDTLGSSSTSVGFTNKIRWGLTAKESSYTSGDVLGLTGSALSSTQTRSVSVNTGIGSFILYAFPSSYTSIHPSGWLFSSMICPFQTAETTSVTNEASYTENYKTYRSTISGLGNSTLTTSTSDTKINPVYGGVTPKLNTYTEADIEGLGSLAISNNPTRSFTVTAGTGSYIAYSPPYRLGSITFYVGGFEGGFETPETVSVTNVNGFAENYRIYRSTNAGLGTTTVVASGA